MNSFIKTTSSILALGFILTANSFAMEEDGGGDKGTSPIKKINTLSLQENKEGALLTPKQKLKQRANQGDAQAQFDLAMLYRKGVGDVIIVKKPLKAIPWLEKAASQDHFDAQYHLADMYINGEKEGIPQDAGKAIKILTNAVKKNNPKAQSLLGSMYMNGKGIDKDEKEAMKWYLKAAEQGDAKAQGGIGYMYYTGGGVKRDEKEGIKWYLKAAEQGDAKAQGNLCCIYIEKKNYKEALKWGLKGAENGEDNAQYNLGIVYERGYGVKKSAVEAMKWYQKAAEQGHADAQYTLGVMYQYGPGGKLKADRSQAIFWYQKSAAQGHLEAQKKLLTM